MYLFKLDRRNQRVQELVKTVSLGEDLLRTHSPADDVVMTRHEVEADVVDLTENNTVTLYLCGTQG